MILSLRHKYIYIRTKKTGSSTIESVLRQNLGPEDIVVGKDFQCLEPVLKPGAKPPDARGGAPTHVPISKIRPVLQDDFWNAAFKFTSERHPYEKAVSLAYWRAERFDKLGRTERRDEVRNNFPNYLDEIVKSGKYSSLRYYCIDGHSVVDDFVRLEHIAPDLRRIADHLGFSIPDELPRERAYSRDDKRPAHEILSNEQKQIIWEHCQQEFELLGYER